MRVPFLDLRIPDESKRRRLLNAIDRVMRHGQFLLGPELTEFETRMAAECGRKFAVGVGSGTAALYLGLRCLGVGPGDEVITTSLSWIATANAIAMTGATPVFADVRDDLNIDPDSVTKLVTPRTKAILPVHYTGRVAEMDAFLQIARDRNLLLVEDAAQAFRATYRDRTAGSFGDIACFSVNPMKAFAGVGEAGFVVTDREDVHASLITARYSGTVNREVCHKPGLNFRMDTIHAAVLLERLSDVDSIIARRRQIADMYRELLSDIVVMPQERDGDRHIYYTFTIQADRRDDLKEYLAEREIESRIQHRLLMPDQPAYRDHVHGEFTNARRLVERVLCIPANETTTDEQVQYVAACIQEFYARP